LGLQDEQRCGSSLGTPQSELILSFSSNLQYKIYNELCGNKLVLDFELFHGRDVLEIWHIDNQN